MTNSKEEFAINKRYIPLLLTAILLISVTLIPYVKAEYVSNEIDAWDIGVTNWQCLTALSEEAGNWTVKIDFSNLTYTNSTGSNYAYYGILDESNNGILFRVQALTYNDPDHNVVSIYDVQAGSTIAQDLTGDYNLTTITATVGDEILYVYNDSNDKIWQNNTYTCGLYDVSVWTLATFPQFEHPAQIDGVITVALMDEYSADGNITNLGYLMAITIPIMVVVLVIRKVG